MNFYDDGTDGWVYPNDDTTVMDYVYNIHVKTLGDILHDFGPFTYRVSCSNNIGITGDISSIQTTAQAAIGASTTFEFPLFPTGVDTADSGCPIISYQATVQSGVTQTGCTSPDTSASCRTIIYVIDAKKTYTVVFTIETSGGMLNTKTVTINVVCGTTT